MKKPIAAAFTAVFAAAAVQSSPANAGSRNSFVRWSALAQSFENQPQNPPKTMDASDLFFRANGVAVRVRRKDLDSKHYPGWHEVYEGRSSDIDWSRAYPDREYRITASGSVIVYHYPKTTRKKQTVLFCEVVAPEVYIRHERNRGALLYGTIGAAIGAVAGSVMPWRWARRSLIRCIAAGASATVAGGLAVGAIGYVRGWLKANDVITMGGVWEEKGAVTETVHYDRP
jgi:hypothetical protein